MQLRTVTGPPHPADREAVRTLAERARAVDGVAPLDEAALLALADEPPASTSPALHLFASDADAGLVGYAQVDRGGPVPTMQLVVDPAVRRQGAGRALVEAAAAGVGLGPQPAAVGPDPQPAAVTGAEPVPSRVRAAATTAGAATPASLEAWAHGDLPAARALAAAAGFVTVPALWRMSVDLRQRPPAAASWPPGFVVRPFAPGRDEEAWLAVNAQAFADHPEQGRWTGHDLQAREREPWFDPAGFLLVGRDEDVAGFVWTKVHPAGELSDEPVGEIYVLGVAPGAQGAGLGRALTAAGLAHLVGRGLRTAVLWVAGDNAAAIRTYQGVGFERAALDVRYARRAGRGVRPADGATMES